MAGATFDDLVEFAFGIADSVSETLPDADYMSVVCCQLEAALLVTDHQACRADPGDMGRLVEIMEQSGALEMAESVDDRVGLGMAADIAMGRLLWGREGPANHYGVVQRG